VNLVFFDKSHPAHLFLIGGHTNQGKKADGFSELFDILKQIEHQERIKRKS